MKLIEDGEPTFAGGITITVAIITFILGMIILCMWGCPRYNVYQQRKEGEAQLAKAQYNRQVAVAEANAKYESATLLSQADTIRAHGIARSNEIIGKSITEPYIQWLWVDEISKTSNQIIYVPAGQMGLPILEANRFKPPVQPVEK